MNFTRTITAIFLAIIMAAGSVGLDAVANTAEAGTTAKEADLNITQYQPEETEPVEAVETVEVIEADEAEHHMTRYYPEVNLPEELQEYIFVQCGEACVDFELVLAIIIQESACDPEAVSGTGDYGLMQINEINHAEMASYGLTDMLDPYQNVVAGITILSRLSDRYGYDEEDMVKVLMAYNMGAGGAAKAWANGIDSTRYTDKVMQIRDSLICGTYEEGGTAA